MEPAGARFLVHQDSSGGSNWRHANHVNRDNRVALSFRGFRAMRDDRLIEGLRATPIVSIGGGTSRVSVTVPRFWQLFPKSIEAETGRCRIGMFPSASKDLHELQGGERSTLTLGICFGHDSVSEEPLAWMRHERTPGILRRAYNLEQDSTVKAQIVRVVTSLMADDTGSGSTNVAEDILQLALSSTDALVKKAADEVMKNRAKAQPVAVA